MNDELELGLWTAPEVALEAYEDWHWAFCGASWMELGVSEVLIDELYVDAYAEGTLVRRRWKHMLKESGDFDDFGGVLGRNFGDVSLMLWRLVDCLEGDVGEGGGTVGLGPK